MRKYLKSFKKRVLKKNKTVKKNNLVPNEYIYERSIEYSFVLRNLVNYKKKSILDVGSGKSAFPALLQNCGFKVTALDKMDEYWKTNKEQINPFYDVIKDDICDLKGKYDLFDAISCISVLEHITTYDNAINGMVSLLKKDGLLILTFPFSDYEYISNVYELQESDKASSKFSYIAQSFSEKEILEWKNKYGLLEVNREYIKGWSGKYWRCGDRVSFPNVTDNKKEADAACFAFIKK